MQQIGLSETHSNESSMRYFTWQRVDSAKTASDVLSIWREYEEYLHNVRHECSTLDPRLHMAEFLHDCYLVGIQRLHMQDLRVELLTPAGGAIELYYSEAESVELMLSPGSMSQAIDIADFEVLYTEIAPLSQRGIFKHSWLSSTGIELAVTAARIFVAER